MKRPVIALTLAVCLALAGPAAANTFVFPHLLETSGSLAGDPGSLSTALQMAWAGDQGCVDGAGDNFVVVWLYSPDGTPLAGSLGPVCAPCVFDLGSFAPFQRISLVEAMVAAGMTPGTDPDAFAIVETGTATEIVIGVRAEAERLDGGGTFRLAGALPFVGQDPGGEVTTCETYVFPHLLEQSGGVETTPDTYDTSIFVAYTDGLGGSPPTAGAGATVTVHLFDQTTGERLMDDGGTPICAPCVYPLGDDGSGTISPRKRKINIESLIENANGAPMVGIANVIAVVTVTGDAEDVAISSLTLNSNTSPLTVSPFGSIPERLRAEVASNVEDVARMFSTLRNHPNPFNPMTTLSYSLPRAGDVTLRVTDVRGRVVRTLEVGRQAEGRHEVTWDGRDDAGRPLPSGTYLARLETADFATVQKMALLK